MSDKRVLACASLACSEMQYTPPNEYLAYVAKADTSLSESSLSDLPIIRQCALFHQSAIIWYYLATTSLRVSSSAG